MRKGVVGPTLDLTLIPDGAADLRTRATVLVLPRGKKSIIKKSDTEVCIGEPLVQPFVTQCVPRDSTLPRPDSVCKGSLLGSLAKSSTILRKSRRQPCTGVVISEDQFATVHHCLPFAENDPKQTLENALVVVGQTQQAAAGELCFPRADVLEVVKRTRSDGPGENDVVAFQVVALGGTGSPGLTPPAICPEEKASGTIEMRGHPLGLPQTKTTNGTVQVVRGKTGLRASIDSFSGNSGSPVFLQSEDCVVGLLGEANLGLLEETEDGCCDLRSASGFGIFDTVVRL